MISRIDSICFPKQHLTTGICTLILVREHFHKPCPRSGLNSAAAAAAAAAVVVVVVVVIVVVMIIILIPEVYELNF